MKKNNTNPVPTLFSNSYERNEAWKHVLNKDYEDVLYFLWEPLQKIIGKHDFEGESKVKENSFLWKLWFYSELVSSGFIDFIKVLGFSSYTFTSDVIVIGGNPYIDGLICSKLISRGYDVLFIPSYLKTSDNIFFKATEVNEIVLRIIGQKSGQSSLVALNKILTKEVNTNAHGKIQWLNLKGNSLTILESEDKSKYGYSIGVFDGNLKTTNSDFNTLLSNVPELSFKDNSINKFIFSNDLVISSMSYLQFFDSSVFEKNNHNSLKRNTNAIQTESSKNIPKTYESSIKHVIKSIIECEHFVKNNFKYKV